MLKYQAARSVDISLWVLRERLAMQAYLWYKGPLIARAISIVTHAGECSSRNLLCSPLHPHARLLLVLPAFQQLLRNLVLLNNVNVCTPTR